MPSKTRFPDGFLWGAATSAYQIEGSPLADGAGPSIWHRFSHTPGRTLNGDTGDVACDHYRRYQDDVALMQSLGLTAYRFSLSWSRILPAGRGRVNPAGLDFYSRLVDRLIASGIVPMVTLYHWDLPAALDDRGGWLNPDCVRWFTDYAEVVFAALGDRVPLWVTLNEPWVIADGGYLYGPLAPGHRNLFEAPIVSHHLLSAHASAVQLYRTRWKQKIGLVVDLEPKEPASDAPFDQAAADRADVYKNLQYLDPVLLGRTPEALREIFGEAWRDWPDTDLERIRQPLDFVGVNYYTRGVVQHDESTWPMRASTVQVLGSTYTETGWEVHPESLTRALVQVRERYGDMPLYVTENGAAFPDPSSAAGDRVADPLRVQYLREHLRAAREAIDRGVDLRGYFAWSLLDNFEWSAGYSKRFGLVHVDFATQRRTLKTSADYYREVIRTHGAILDEPLPMESR
ncbi:MAG TPA: GH1 family beta-glucosidase [Candidatus Limnocylindria bacterium]|nr:GH1 family beta-glucosidase [Candidatus Limnocylindria bacterium]